MKKSNQEFEQKLAKPAKKKYMFCDFCVWRVRQPSKIAKRCSLEVEEVRRNTLYRGMRGTTGF
jgi:hypothetical protein